MEINSLQGRLINRVKEMSGDQLAWLEMVLDSTCLPENETEVELVHGIMMVQEDSGTLDFLTEEEGYSEKDAIAIYRNSAG
jgi:hypothetical protein